MTGLGKIIFWIAVGTVFGISSMLVLHYWPAGDEAEDPLGPEHVSTPFGDEGRPTDEADDAEPVPAAPADGETAEEAPAQEERPEEPAAPPVVKDASVTTEKAKALLAKAAELDAVHKSVAARNAYGDALGAGLSAKDAASVKAKLSKLNEKILFGARLVTDDTDSKMYRIRSGDSLSVIAKRYFITVGLLKRINRMGSDMIYAGQWLKVLNGPFEVQIYKSRFEMQVWLRGRFIKAYSVALGRGDLTPVGNYVVKLKIPNPPYQPRHKPRSAWRRPEDPDNPLGERWIAFETNRGLGIHGTIEPASMGKSVSDGCVRMLAKDVVELYDLVVPGVSKVSIKP